VKIAIPRSPVSPLLWFSVLGAPFAWAAQFGISYWVTEAKCSVAGTRWGISVDAWVIVLTVLAAVVAVGGGYVALSLFRATNGVEQDGEPPSGRTRFFAYVGLTVTPIFLAIIVLNGIGAVVHSCVQS
jgi:hypothetical protein